MDINFLAKRITELRLSKNISSRKLSLDLGLSNSYITQIENGKKLPSIENLFKICDYFGITLSDFFATEDTSEPLSDDLKELVDSAKSLTPEQRRQLSKFLRLMTKE